jgi:hypothetical protein
MTGVVKNAEELENPQSATQDHGDDTFGENQAGAVKNDIESSELPYVNDGIPFDGWLSSV